MKQPGYSIGFISQENEITLDELPVEGIIPEWLSGSLIRTAPSKFETGSKQYRHWFDGLAMLHKFTLRNQQVGYSCKFLKSNAYRLATETGKIVYGEFGTDPCQDLFRKVVSFFTGPKATDNGCVNILQYGEELAAVTETRKPIVFRLNDLETQGQFLDEPDEVPGHIAIVHPHYDKDGVMFSYTTNFSYKSTYNVYSQLPISRTRKLIASVPADKPAYMHSMGMTENFIILTEFPLLFNLFNLRFGIRPLAESYHWLPEKGTTVYLIEKTTGAIQSFKTEPFFSFHHVNAFEQNEEVVFDLVGYKDAEVINHLYLNQLRSKPTSDEISGQLWRFRITPTTGSITRQIITPVPLELPRINYTKVNAKPYQYAYAAGTTVPGNFLDNITKINVTTGKEVIWYEEYCYPGEPVFVERPQANKEDDGVILSIVLDASIKTSFLLVLDASDLKEIARVRVPQHITFGFHGQFVREN